MHLTEKREACSLTASDDRELPHVIVTCAADKAEVMNTISEGARIVTEHCCCIDCKIMRGKHTFLFKGPSYITAALHYKRFTPKCLTDSHHSCLQTRKCCCTFVAEKQSHLVWLGQHGHLSKDFLSIANTLTKTTTLLKTRGLCCGMFHGHATVVGTKGPMPADG